MKLEVRNSARDIEQVLKQLGNPERAAVSRRFFKTDPGQYGEGDVFVGIPVPNIRKLVREYTELDVTEIEKLLHSPIHEARMLALYLFIAQYKKGNEQLREKIYKTYLRNIRKYINNWDLIDTSAEHIVGWHLEDRSKSTLIKLAKSTSLWERRVAMLATFRYIKQGDASTALEVAEILVNDSHDLIHKAVGWMLREIGQRCSLKIETDFLDRHAPTMPRTMLRYAIEKFPTATRQRYLGSTKI